MQLQTGQFSPSHLIKLANRQKIVRNVAEVTDVDLKQSLCAVGPTVAQEGT